MSIISPDNTFALAAALSGAVAFALWCERFPFGKTVGSALIVMLSTLLLSNIHVLPFKADLYGSATDLLVPLAIPMLLFRANLRRVITESGPLLAVFFLATVVTSVGALVGSFIVDLGSSEPKLVGTLAASYIGGSLNFVSTASAVGLTDSTLFVSAKTADTLGAVIFLTLLMTLPGIALLRKLLPSRHIGNDNDLAISLTGASGGEARNNFSSLATIFPVATSFAICAISHSICNILDMGHLFILVVTCLSLAVASLAERLVTYMQHEFEIGTLFMYFFFAIIGAGADISLVLSSALPILAFILAMVGVHLVLILSIGSLLKLDLADIMVASNACILGPAPAAALAASRGWLDLVTPAILAGLLGYAIATFIGMGITHLLG